MDVLHIFFRGIDILRERVYVVDQSNNRVQAFKWRLISEPAVEGLENATGTAKE
jgi:hypothetical protein